MNPIQTPIWLEYLKAAGPFVATVGVLMAYYQLRKTVRWNKLYAAFNFFPNETVIQREEAAVAQLAVCGITHHRQTAALPEEIVTRLIEDPTAYRAVKSLLNLFEEYALAVRAHVLDEEAAFRLMSHTLTRHFLIFEPLILRRRKELESAGLCSAGLWQEFEFVARQWTPRLRAENQALLDAQQKARKEYEEKMKNLPGDKPPKSYDN